MDNLLQSLLLPEGPLTKEALLPVRALTPIGRIAHGIAVEGPLALGRFIRSPVQTVQRGWNMQSPGFARAQNKNLWGAPSHIAGILDKVRNRPRAIVPSSNPFTVIGKSFKQGGRRELLKGMMKGDWSKGKRRANYVKGGLRGTAEELSRRGWTGEGKITKYLPVGNKALTVGFTGLAANDILRAKDDPNDSRLGRLAGTAAGTAAFLGTGGASLPASIAASTLADTAVHQGVSGGLNLLHPRPKKHAYQNQGAAQ